ncbi:MAG: hypothetical protein CL567_00340 [Alphaproteobacteria bacterium]|nr:hypothetical protein [Alphaproteobacteria bacterium]|tara:strand:+ start:50 stop:634 length:585 start_codon:yes stop_codon:yes gene_type:complete
MKITPQIINFICGLFFGLLILWSIGLVWFAAQTSNNNLDQKTQTDAIIVLTGGSGRLSTGLELLNLGLSKQLFVTGVAEGLKPEDVYDLSETTLSDFSCCITFGHKALNTTENAIETALWAKPKGLRNFRIVTGSYHMPRSMLEFRRIFPDSILVAHPVYPEHVKVNGWWFHHGTARLITSEYAKSILILLKAI